MRDKLTDQEKLDFITRNGWIMDKNGHAGRYRKKEWDDEDDSWTRQGFNPYQHPYSFRNESLHSAYEHEMEEEYDRLTIMLRDAKKIMLRSDYSIEMSEWLENYEKWTQI